MYLIRNLLFLIFCISILNPLITSASTDTSSSPISLKEDELPSSSSSSSMIDASPSEQEESESYVFKAEVTRLLDLIINYLYTQKDRFIRELISNSIDALEKQRIKQFENSDIFDELEIRVRINVDEKTISIRDTGIGMTKFDLINNLGTVAKSGTSNFLESIAKHGDANLIGQFGVGFYSAYLVADKVTVVSRHDDDVAYVWQSSADESFTIYKRSDALEEFGRGTEVILHLKSDATEYLDSSTLLESIERFSQFMPFPIYMEVEKVVDVEVDDDEEEVVDVSSEIDVDVEEKVLKKKKTVQRTVNEWEKVNKQKPVWLRNKSEVTTQEYEDFYSSIAKDGTSPLAWVHFSGEGEIEFKSILFIPDKAPEEVYENYFYKQTAIKLYVRRVLVQEQFDKLLPKYLSFVKGVVDSDDVPLNVARDQLQEQKILKLISKKLVRKILELIRKLMNEGEKEKNELNKQISEVEDENEKNSLTAKLQEGTLFDKLWNEYSKHLKLGCFDDDVNRAKVAKILKLQSTTTLNGYTTLDKYVSNMGDNQTDIYYAAGTSVEQLMALPQLQMFLKKNIEVLLLVDTMDEPCMQKLVSYEGKKLVSVQKQGVDLQDSDSDKRYQKKLKVHYDPLLKWFAGILKSKVGKVELSKRLVDAPCAVVSAAWGYSANMERIMKAQTFADNKNLRLLGGSKVFELNPNHPLVVKLLEKVKENEEDEELKKSGVVLFNMAMLASGFEVDRTEKLSEDVYRLIALQGGVDPDGAMVDINVEDIDADDDDDDVQMDDMEAAKQFLDENPEMGEYGQASFDDNIEKQTNDVEETTTQGSDEL